jgi:hypothetical protein
MLNGAPKDANVVREVRHGFLQLALTRVPAYLSIVEAIDFDRVSLPRASALLMLLFTDRHYRSCARQVGLSPWPGADSWTAILRQALPAVVSTRYTRRVLSRIERNFLSL